MNFERKKAQRGRVSRGRIFQVESLEQRALLAATAETFTGPSLNDLITLAKDGTDTSSAAINRMLNALETQLTSGPLADLTGGTVDGNGFVTGEVFAIQRLINFTRPGPADEFLKSEGESPCNSSRPG